MFEQFLQYPLTLEDVANRARTASCPTSRKWKVPRLPVRGRNPLDKLPSDGPADQDVRPHTTTQRAHA